MSSETASPLLSETDSLPSPRPFLKWAGGKTQLLDQLIPRLPYRYSRYFEPFLGGGALFFSLQPKRAVLSDLSSDLIETYEAVRDHPAPLITALEQHRYEREHFYRVRNSDRTESFQSWSAIEKAARFIFLNRTCFNGLYRVNSRGHFNVPFGRYTNPRIADPENLFACSRALAEAALSVGSFDSIEENVTGEDFVYLDPPYAPLSATSNFVSYSKEGFDREMQVSLRDLCVRLDARGVRFMLSNSSAPLILDLYAGFRIERVGATRAINSHGERRGAVDELIIRNY